MMNELILVGVAFFHPQPQHDSLGIETVNGKIYVIHKVDEKETLYAISKRYGTTVDVILQSNPSASTTLEVGQVLKVPYTPKATVKVPANATVHKVAAKETMFSISKTYGVTIDEIKQWNNLSDNTLSIGQELIVKKPKAGTSPVVTSRPAENTQRNGAGTHTVAAKETMYSIARQHGVSVQQLKEWNKFDSDELKIGQVVLVAAPERKIEVARQEPTVAEVKPEVKEVKTEVKTETKKETQPAVVEASRPKTETPAPTTTQTIRISESVKNSDEVMESGLAELIEGTEGNRKYLALHRTAPVGTILKVKNEMNNREVFVRVMGKLPDTAMTDKLVIKISKSAYDRLGAIDPRFRVEVTYYK